MLPETGAPDDVYEPMARDFDPAEQVELTLAIVAASRHPEPVAAR